jgi:hypothetical protein
MLVGFVLQMPGTQADPSDSGSRSSGVSVFGTIHPDLYRLAAPLGSGPRFDRVRVASLGPSIRSDALSGEWGGTADVSASGCHNAPFAERFTLSDLRSASFEERFASGEDCTASFDERFASAAQVLASSLRQAPDREPETRQAAIAPKTVIALPQSRPKPPPVRRDTASLLEDDGRTAIYDITARIVYLPGGRRLEAHSGLGEYMDNPRYQHLRMRGVTPPNVYTLTMRERLFHGVRAIRLNPVDESRMHGRAGILAHTYMLGPNGQSNGCISFNDYPEFLNAYLRGEITRIAVVERLESPPGRLAAGTLPEAVKDLMRSTDRNRQYAAAR